MAGYPTFCGVGLFGRVTQGTRVVIIFIKISGRMIVSRGFSSVIYFSCVRLDGVTMRGEGELGVLGRLFSVVELLGCRCVVCSKCRLVRFVFVVFMARGRGGYLVYRSSVGRDEAAKVVKFVGGTVFGEVSITFPYKRLRTGVFGRLSFGKHVIGAFNIKVFGGLPGENCRGGGPLSCGCLCIKQLITIGGVRLLVRIFGGGNQRLAVMKAKRLRTRLGAVTGDGVAFLNFVPGHGLPRICRRRSVFVLPSGSRA